MLVKVTTIITVELVIIESNINVIINVMYVWQTVSKCFHKEHV